MEAFDISAVLIEAGFGKDMNGPERSLKEAATDDAGIKGDAVAGVGGLIVKLQAGVFGFEGKGGLAVVCFDEALRDFQMPGTSTSRCRMERILRPTSMLATVSNGGALAGSVP